MWASIWKLSCLKVKVHYFGQRQAGLWKGGFHLDWDVHHLVRLAWEKGRYPGKCIQQYQLISMYFIQNNYSIWIEIVQKLRRDLVWYLWTKVSVLNLKTFVINCTEMIPNTDAFECKIYLMKHYFWIVKRNLAIAEIVSFVDNWTNDNIVRIGPQRNTYNHHRWYKGKKINIYILWILA